MEEREDTISRQAAIDALTEYGNGRAVFISVGEAIIRIEQLPSAQPEIIRCKNCVWWQREWSDERDYHYCTMEDDRTYREFYCANAERREE